MSKAKAVGFVLVANPAAKIGRRHRFDPQRDGRARARLSQQGCAGPHPCHRVGDFFDEREARIARYAAAAGEGRPILYETDGRSSGRSTAERPTSTIESTKSGGVMSRCVECSRPMEDAEARQFLECRECRQRLRSCTPIRDFYQPASTPRAKRQTAAADADGDPIE